jgi:hypothetical protein
VPSDVETNVVITVGLRDRPVLRNPGSGTWMLVADLGLYRSFPEHISALELLK